jgi:hypothetical protein
VSSFLRKQCCTCSLPELARKRRPKHARQCLLIGEHRTQRGRSSTPDIAAETESTGMPALPEGGDRVLPAWYRSFP